MDTKLELSDDRQVILLNSIKEEAEAADLYNKRAFSVDDPHAREVYRDIAKEEMVHLGEASQLLAEADPELAAEVPKGMEEAGGGKTVFRRQKRAD